MTPRAIRRTWFVGLWLLLPWPMVVFTEQLVPAVRYTLLATAASAVAVSEGAAGPVLPLVGLFVGWAIGTTLGCWAIAWLTAHALARLPEREATAITWVAIGLGAVAAQLLAPYHTYFGRAATGGLLEILS